MLAWFHALMPKEERFFDLFSDHAGITLACAEAVRRLLEGGEAVPERCREIIDREHEADTITREVMLAVRRTFITPFDRGDIVDLITSMDDAVDQMHDTAKTIAIYEIRNFEPEMREIGDIIVKAASLTVEAVSCLRHLRKHASRLTTIAEEITRIEGLSDELHDASRKKLFQAHAGSNPMAYLIGSEIYESLETVVDRFDDVGNEISGLVIEHV